MPELLSLCEQLYNISRIPLMAAEADGSVLGVWPQMPPDYLLPGTLKWVIDDYHHHQSGGRDPLITCIEPGFFLGICELPKERYAVIGLVSPTPHTRQEIIAMCTEVIRPACLQSFVDVMLKMPLFGLEQVRDMICLVNRLVYGESISPERILFNDRSPGRRGVGETDPELLFSGREEGEFHVPTAYVDALCHAIEQGSRQELTAMVYALMKGRVGRMSWDELRQIRYASVCLAVLLSRAAIRGGLPEEEAFTVSDAFCQHMDQLKDPEQIRRLSLSMMFDLCDRVKAAGEKKGYTKVVRICLNHISVHLHGPITLEDLSRSCGLCTRSLSLRFRKEVGMGINEYIHREKVKEARYLLEYTDYSLAEISSFLNYPSQSYFTRIFRKYAGTTPQRYREGLNGSGAGSGS